MLWEKNNQKEMTIAIVKNDQPKRQLLFEMQNKRVGNYILFQQEITSRGCKPSILEM